MGQSGVTLIELLVVLAVSAILLAVGVPSFASLIQSTRLTSATNELVASLSLARSEAIKRSGRAVMCVSATGTSCAGRGWHEGWLVFHDANGNARLDTGEVVVMRRGPLSAGLQVTSEGSTARYVSYAPSGGTKQVNGAWQAGTLTLCDTSRTAGPGRKVIISSTGRVRTAKMAQTACA